MNNKTRKLILALSLMAIAIFMTVCDIPIITDAYEPNDSFEEAKTISLGSQVRATIEPSGDMDYFRFTVSEGGSEKVYYRLTVPSTLRPEIRFYDSGHAEIYRNHSSVAGDMLYDSLEISPGDYFLRVTSFSFEESDSSYVLVVTSGGPVFSCE